MTTRAILKAQAAFRPFSLDELRWNHVAEAYKICDLSGVPVATTPDQLVAQVVRASAWCSEMILETSAGRRYGLLGLTEVEYERHRPYGTEESGIHLPADNLAAGLAKAARWRR